METHEILTLIGIILTFLTTITGWILISIRQNSILKKQIASQKDITELSNRLSEKREHRIRVLENIFVYLDELEDWLELGRNIYLKATTVSIDEVDKFRGIKTDDF